VTLTTESLRAQIDRVRVALGDECADGIRLTYAVFGGEWAWEVYVDAKRKPYGRGRRTVRGALHAVGETPEAAVNELLRKVAIPGYLEV
jgi:hypothetical protein